MKKQLIDYVRSLGGNAHYAGNTIHMINNPAGIPDEVRGSERTMYIDDPMIENVVTQSIEECVLNKFGYNLPFKLQTN